MLEEVHQGLLARISFFRSRSMSLKGRVASSYAEMNAIYEAIASHDRKAAERAARTHVIKAKAAAKLSMNL